MIDVVSFLPGKRKQTNGGWLSFNAPCCVHNGENPDKRMRGGLKTSHDGGWSFHCFNCSFKASFVPGRSLTFKAKKFLSWLGVDDQTIEMVNLESLRYRSIHGMLETNREVIRAVEFKTAELPDGVELLSLDKPAHLVYNEYLVSRAIDTTVYTYMVSPDADGRSRDRIVIPFTHNDTIVGSTSHYIDGKTPKYINDMQTGYVFGIDLQQVGWQHLIVVEGVFDALSINACAVLHNDINSQQVQVIKALQRSVTVVPDLDKAGMNLVDRAVELGWAVSIPDWPDSDIKDVNDAVKRYGKLATLMLIMRYRETSKIKIELRKKQIGKRL